MGIAEGNVTARGRCGACGERVCFAQGCSRVVTAKEALMTWFNPTKKVRLCETCYDERGREGGAQP